MKRLLLRGAFRAFGEALHEAWLVKKRMSAKISNPRIDAIYAAARAAGALGGKISGAGGGGFMFFFAEFDRRHSVEAALRAEGAEPVHFGFTDAGLQTWVR
jgi:D-glycero-alpha-D-manno-heptose-7-phosphate kinase